MDTAVARLEEWALKTPEIEIYYHGGPNSRTGVVEWFAEADVPEDEAVIVDYEAGPYPDLETACVELIRQLAESGIYVL